MIDNITAFLDMISYSEGTKGKGDDGYNVDFGGTLFSSYADHPRIRVFIPKLGEYTTAAGRYQVKESIYDFYKPKLGLVGFYPADQDAIAKQLIKECNALNAIVAGELDTAILKCASRWASFPTAGYAGQPENKMQQMRDWFTQSGGILNV